MIIPKSVKNKTSEEIFKEYTNSNEEYILFYHGPFSQWWPSQFTINGETYNCAEQYMMMEKARLFRDMDSWVLMQLKRGPWDGTVVDFTKYPKIQKQLGRKVKDFDPDVWNENAKRIVTEANIAKFNQNDYMKEVLELTKGKKLVEASPVDNVWGTGLSLFDSNNFDKSKWKGTNWLGECLTEARIDLLGS